LSFNEATFLWANFRRKRRPTQQPLNGTQKLIPEQYRCEVSGPQDHWPIPRSVVPKVRGHGEKLHKRQRKHPRQRQEKLLHDFFSTLTPTPEEQQNHPRSEKSEEQHVPTGVEIKQYIHAANQTKLCYKKDSITLPHCGSCRPSVSSSTFDRRQVYVDQA
jgi:hypothetical protein